MAKAPRKCSPALASAIVACWIADAECNRISTDVWGEDYLPHSRIRVLLPYWNKLANNAAWDGQYESAKRYLINHGICDNEAKSPAHDSEIKRTRRNYAQAMFSVARAKDQRRHSNEMQSVAGIKRKRLK